MLSRLKGLNINETTNLILREKPFSTILIQEFRSRSYHSHIGNDFVLICLSLSFIQYFSYILLKSYNSIAVEIVFVSKSRKFHLKRMIDTTEYNRSPFIRGSQFFWVY